MAETVEFKIVVQGKNVSLVQKQTDKLAKSTDKAGDSTDRLRKKTDKYSRRQKGVAEMGMNTTKSFSKMQQNIDGGGGAGGLVRAYALLAANVFALTAAFGVLSRSAQIDTLIESMEILSVTGGTYIKTLAMDMRDASGGAIDLAQAFRQVSLASSAGLNTEEIEGLTMVAKGAALSLGRDLPDAMDRIFRGAIKLEPEILDEIGLFVRVDEAAEKYARTVGKSAAALTQAEKRQGFLNEILDQGTRKFQQYADEVKPDPYVKIAAALSDIAQNALSMVNNVFGPLIGFLSESKGLLALVFGALVFTLLKMAIPAIGQFNLASAESAALAAKNAKDYTDGIRETTNKKIEEDKKQVKSELKKQRDLNRARKPKPIAVGGRKESAAIEKKLQSTKVKGLERVALIEKRIKDLKRGQNKAEVENKALYQAEIDALEEEVRLNKELVRLNQQKKKGKKGVEPGTLAGRRQESLNMTAMSAASLSMVTQTAETDGLRAGWGKLNDEMNKTQKVGGKTVPVFKGLGKAGIFMKGSLSLAAVGAQSLMMALGPIVMIFSLAMAVLVPFAKWLGIGGKEATALTEATNKLNEVTETLGERFKTQTDQIKSGTLSYVEAANAADAFSRGQVDVVQRMKQVGEALETFEKEATDVGIAWDSFVGFISFGNWGVQAKSNIALVDGAAEQMAGAIRAGNDELVGVFSGALEGSEDFQAAVKNQIAAEDEMEKKKKALGEVSRKEMRHLDMVAKLRMLESKAVGSQKAQWTRLIETHTKGLTPAAIDYTKAQGNVLMRIKETESAQKDLAGSSDDLLDAADLATAGLGEQGAVITEAAAATMALKSALEDASESAGKFSATFVTSTKIDDFSGSLSATDAAARKTEEGINALLTSIGTEDSNPFFRFFTDAQKEILKTAETAEDGGEAAQKIWDDAVEETKRYQKALVMTKVIHKDLTDEIKRLGEVTSLNDALATDMSVKQTAVAKNAHNMADLAFKQRLFDKGMDEDKFKALVAQVAEKETMVEKEAVMTGTGMTLLDLYSMQADKQEEIRKSMDLQVAQLTETERANIEITKHALAQVAAQKTLNKAKQKEAELTAKVNMLAASGSMKLSPQQEAKLEISAALMSFQIAKEEAELKGKMLDYEMLVQQVKLQVLRDSLEADDPRRADIGFRKGETVDGKEVGESSGFFKNIENASTVMKEALETTAKNAEGIFILALTSGIKKGFTGGVYEGTLALSEAMKKLDETTFEKPEDKAKAKSALFLAGMRESVDAQAEMLKKLGPEGELVAQVAQGAMVMTAAFAQMNLTIEEGGSKAAAMANFAAQAIGQISAIMAANSRAQLKEIDNQIEAEKRRDGKSKESQARIAAMEKKKEAMKKKAFEQNKKMMMAQTIMATAASVIGMMAAPDNFTATQKLIMAGVAAAMGAAQLAIISRMTYQGGGGSVEKPQTTALNVGKRTERVDVSRGASGGELGYLRGQRGMGGPQNFVPTGGAAGLRRGYAEGGVLVGE